MTTMSSASAVQAAYDRVAAAYDRQFRDELALKPLDRALLTAFVELVANGPIADVGCGPGHITRFLSERHREVARIDLSPAWWPSPGSVHRNSRSPSGR